jgi:hypothetical protein
MLLILSITFKSFGAIVGSGRGSVGTSLDQDDVNTGLEGAYMADVKTRAHELNGLFNFEKVFDDGRATTVSGHSYQYNSAYVNAVIDHKYNTASPYLKWINRAQYNYDADSISSEPRSWTLLTGPQYIKRIRPDITLDIQLSKARQEDNQYLSDENSGVFRLSRSLNSQMIIAGEFERYCTDYSDKEIIDSCSNETSAEVSVKSGIANYRLRIGRFEVHNKSYPTYQFDYDYKPNTSDIYSLGYAKSNNSIRSTVLTDDSNLLPDPATFTTSLTGRYLHDFKRVRILLEMKKSETENETDLVQEAQYSAQADYRLSSDKCRACLIHLSYDRDNNEISNWQSTSFGIDIPWIKNFYNQFSIRYTSNDNSESFYSLDWVINYNGRPSILSR